MTFLDRVCQLPMLGMGVSTEYGAFSAPNTLRLDRLHHEYPQFGQFLEVGVEVSKGVDDDALAWVAQGLATTYHFLDINLDEMDDFDESWLSTAQEWIERLNPAWICGDLGLWHFGPRDRNHMLLLPPILTTDSAKEMAEGICVLRERLGREVLPENPPGVIYIGELDLLDYFARVIDRADTGMLLDCAHLAMYQQLMGRKPTQGLADFPLDRIIEMHVAGGAQRNTDGFQWIEDDHGLKVLPETWEIFEYVAQRASNLRAVVMECERNPLNECLAMMSRAASILGSHRMGTTL